MHSNFMATIIAKLISRKASLASLLLYSSDPLKMLSGLSFNYVAMNKENAEHCCPLVS